MVYPTADSSKMLGHPLKNFLIKCERKRRKVLELVTESLGKVSCSNSIYFGAVSSNQKIFHCLTVFCTL